MSEQSSPVIQLNDHMAGNWKRDAAPVAVLNVDSTTHERVAYCWGVALNLRTMMDLCATSSDAEVSEVATLVISALGPLVAVLDRLGYETFKAESEGRNES